jgi:segregation and condensation protein A
LDREFEPDTREHQGSGDRDRSFVVDVDGFEGPLDLLLELARRQKVDLQKISVLALADQYLEFIEMVRGLRLELAADYLVMAAWLAYLKSRLLLPRAPKDEQPAATELAEALQFRLQRLEAIRAAAEALDSRPRLGRETFSRGQPETFDAEGVPQWQASLYELLAAYASRRQRHVRVHMTVAQRFVWSLAQARREIEKIAGQAPDWTGIDPFLAAYCATPEMRRTVRASALSASLEMVREGLIAIRQDAPFAPLWIKKKSPDSTPPKLVSG